jgi:hypothetical protein
MGGLAGSGPGPSGGVEARVTAGVQKKFGKLVDSFPWHFYFARRHWAKTQDFASPKPFRKGRGLRFFVVCWHQDFAIFGARVAQLAERVLGKDEVISSNLIVGSICRSN